MKIDLKVHVNDPKFGIQYDDFVNSRVLAWYQQ